MAVFLGCVIVAGVIFYVGRQIARVLWGILVVIENDKEQRAVLEKQRAELFGDKPAPTDQKRHVQR